MHVNETFRKISAAISYKAIYCNIFMLHVGLVV